MNDEIINNIKEKVEIAKKIVENENNEFKIEIFKIVLQNLLGNTMPNKPAPQAMGLSTMMSEQSLNVDPLTTLATVCQISIDELRNVLEYDKNKFVLLKSPNEKTELQNQIIATQCILTAWKKSSDIEWVSASEIITSLENRGIGTNHLSENLATAPKLIKKMGNGKGTKYGLTTLGWQEGIELLKKLATS